MRRYLWRCLDRDEGGLQRQSFLRMHPNPFMDEVGIEVVCQRDIGNRDVRLCALGNDLSLEGFGIGTAFLWHGRPLKKARNGVHLNLGGHHRLKRRCQEGVLPGRLRFTFIMKVRLSGISFTSGCFLRAFVMGVGS